MKLNDEVKIILDDYETRPLDAYQKVQESLRSAVRKGGQYDPLKSDDEWNEGRKAYHTANNYFKERKWFYASEKLLLDWWNYLGLLQFEENQRIYRAECAFLLSELYEEMDEPGLALHWAMLMQADDVLGEHHEGGGAGRQMLTTRYGLSTFVFDELNLIANDCLNEVKQDLDWSKPAGFAEEVICRFAQSEVGYALAETTSNKELPVSLGFFKALQNQMEAAQTSNEKGDALEFIAFYLLLILPGCVPHKNVLAEQKIFETDVLVHNLSPASTVVTDLLGRHFLIECKNRKSKNHPEKNKVTVSEIGYFLYRMKLTHTKFGIIFSRDGITGEEDKEAGYELIRRAFHEDDLVCVVIDDYDLKDLESGDIQYFWWMLLEKIERLRFGKQKSNS